MIDTLAPRMQPIAAGRTATANLDERRAANAELIAIAQPHLEWLSKAHLDMPHIASLVDRDGVVLASAARQGDIVRGSRVAAMGAPVHAPNGEPVGAIKLSVATDEDASSRLLVVAHVAFAIGQELKSRESLQATGGHLETERRLSEALRVSESRFRSLSASSPVGIFHSDNEANITYANPRLQQIWGINETEGLGRGWLTRIHPEDVDAVMTGWGEALAVQAEYEHEYRLLMPDGSIRWVHCRSAPLLDARGTMTGTVGTIEEITEQRALEAQLRQAQKMEAVGQLAGGIAHDFNNLLTIIDVHAELALEDLEEANGLRDDLLEVKKASARAAGLTRQLLAFSRKQLLQPERLPLNAVVDGVAPMLRRLIGEDIAVIARLDPESGSVFADPGQLEQVVINLAVNARDAMLGGGTLTIETSKVAVDERSADEHEAMRGRYVCLTVSDTGCGMSAEVQERIFEPFFTTKPAGQGTGLGLSTVYGIVRQSGGHILVDSEPGQGTSFRVYLPTAEVPESALPAIPERSACPCGTEIVLLVEDEDAVRALARRILERQGYTVLDACNGRDALVVAARGGRIDLVLTDVVMPEMNGRALAEALAVARPSLPVLYMSGYTDDEIVRRGLLDTSNGLLQKPFTADSLARAVRSALAEQRAA